MKNLNQILITPKDTRKGPQNTVQWNIACMEDYHNNKISDFSQPLGYLGTETICTRIAGHVVLDAIASSGCKELVHWFNSSYTTMEPAQGVGGRQKPLNKYMERHVHGHAV